jgi:hypothetical protein
MVEPLVTEIMKVECRVAAPISWLKIRLNFMKKSQNRTSAAENGTNNACDL